jgi:uncharacterized protein (TIGR02284 family)
MVSPTLYKESRFIKVYGAQFEELQMIQPNDQTRPDAHQQAGSLNEMIEVLNDGKQFYAEAASELKREDLRALFRRMATHKEQVAGELSKVVASLGEQPASDGTFSGSIRKLYAEVRTKLSSDSDHEFVAQLEEFEDRIKHAFERVVAESNDTSARQVADKYFSSVKKDHDIMRDLKKDPAQRAS